jgi:UDP-glucose 4-epimerase
MRNDIFEDEADLQNLAGKKLKVMITGASGRIGERLVYWLEKYTDFALILTSRRKPVFNSQRSVWVQGDIRSTTDLNKIFMDQPDIIVHLASTVGDKNSPSIASYENQELVPTLSLLDFLLSKKMEVKFIFASSGGTVYQDSKMPHFETDLVQCSSLYSCNKVFVENLLWLYRETLHPMILRISNPYGMKIDPNIKQGVIDIALNCALNDKSFNVYGDVNNVRDFIHIDDLCKAFIKSICFDGSEYEVFNIGSGVGISISEIIKYIKKLFPKFRYNVASNVDGYISCNILDISKARQLLDWQPSISVEAYLKSKANSCSS